MSYQEKYCTKCVHDINHNCPIWLAHLLYNYDEANNDKSILNLLIPQAEGGLSNGQCKMFIEKKGD